MLKGGIFVSFFLFTFFASALDVAIFTKPAYFGETAFSYRVEKAAKKLGWNAEVIFLKRRKEIQNRHFDFVIMNAPCPFRMRTCPNYLSIYHPKQCFFSESGKLLEKFSKRNGYLLSFEPKKEDLNFQEVPSLTWYPTVERREYKKVEPKELFFICPIWGNRFDDPKYQTLFSLLANETFSSFYGSSLFEKKYPKAYRGEIPFEDESLFEKMQQAGVTLVIHSNAHNEEGIPSGRIFEAAASSTVIISDQNPFVKKHFGSSVLYIDLTQDAESIFQEIQAHMNWIQRNPDSALKMAKLSHSIFLEKFVLEDQLERLLVFHNSQSLTQKQRFLKLFTKKIY